MYFRCIYIVRDFHVKADDSCNIDFEINENEKISISLKLPSEEEINIGFSDKDYFCYSELQLVPSNSIIKIFQDLISETKPEYLQKFIEEYTSRLSENDNQSNFTLATPLSILPPHFQEFSRNIYDTLTDAIKRVIKLIRWRYQLQNQSHNPFSAKDYLWSFDRSEWNSMPYSYHISVEDQTHLKFSKKSNIEIQALLDNRVDEPVYHDLFLEALNARRQGNYRSSVLITISALEICIKKIISDFVPDAGWLITEIQSPPIEKIFAEYFQKIIKSSDGLSLYNSLDISVIRQKLKTFVNIRNELAHGKRSAIDLVTLNKMIEFTRYFLQMADNLRGYVWSPTNVQPLNSTTK